MNLLPLRLSPFERYMVEDERTAYPMTFPIVIDCQGIPDAKRTEQAFIDVLKRHPLQAAKLSGSGRSMEWREGDQLPTVHWRNCSLEDPIANSKAIDIRDTCPIHLQVEVDRERCRFIFYFHHAGTDGVGAFQLIGDFFALYGQSPTSALPALKPIDFSALASRLNPRLKIPHPISRWQTLRSSWTQWSKWLTRRSVALAPSEDTGQPAQGNSWLTSCRLSVDQWNRYREVADQFQVTTNDLFLRDLFLTLKQWNEPHQKKKEWLRILVPTNLRNRHSLASPAANFIGYGMVMRRAAACIQSRSFLNEIGDEIKFMMKWKTGIIFVDGIGIVDHIPGLLRLLTSWNNRFATIVFSNLGEIRGRFRAKFPVAESGDFVAGNLKLTNITGCPPVRPGTAASIAAIAYAGSCTLTAAYDAAVWTQQDANQFLILFMSKIQETASQDGKL